jgi:uncharacterized protein YqeY
MSVRIELNTAMKESMKSRDTVRLNTVRLILAALKDRDIAARTQGQADGIPDSDVMGMLATMVKQRQESSKIYAEAGREDMAEQEDAEIKIVQSFMPEQLSQDKLSEIIDSLVEKTGADSVRDMGKVMGALKSEYAGQIDMTIASGMVKSKLG